MKIYKYTYILILTILFSSCEDYLDKSADFEGLEASTVFSDIVLTKQFLDGGYSKLLSEVSAVSNGSDYMPPMTMGGEGFPGRLNNEQPETYNNYAQGDYLSLMNQVHQTTNANRAPHFAVRYKLSWQGIRIVNTFLQEIDNVTNSNEEEINSLKGQAYFLRAHFYHLLTKRHGGLVYLKENIQLDESLDRVRESYDSNLVNMLEDLDLAIDLLPVSWASENVGRPTKGAAMALKSRLTLFAASPLTNPSEDQQKWIDAAAAASDLINYSNANGLYALVDASAAINIDVDNDGTDLLIPEPEELQPYRSIFVGPGISKAIPQEVIFSEVNQRFYTVNTITNPTPRIGLTCGFDIIKGNNTPVNIGALPAFVAKFETKNGLAIEDDPTYNDQNPFINRDPRFYNAILFDGVAWQHTTAGAINSTGFVDLAVRNEEGEYGKDLNDPSVASSLLWRVQNATGFRIRKWIPHGAYWRSGTNVESNFHVNNNLFRMSEVYLNFAEAANEAYGPTGAVPGASLTAVDAINIIRNRVGMPNVNAQYTGSKDDFRDRIHNERAIELCFEGFSYDDIRRWKTADKEENKKVEFLEMLWQGGKSAIYPTGFSFQNVEQPQLKKTFNSQHYWWPIPSSEIEAVPGFEQTPGW